MANVRKEVSQYYAQITKEQAGKMRTNICSCGVESMPKHIRPLVSQLPDEIVTRFYGCGSPLPLAIEGCTVLDLGCGTGRDCYIASKLVGEKGRVIGVDMTAEQLDLARRYQDEMAEKYGYKESNVEFKEGYIEDLKSLGIEDGSVDVVISNCVINLSPNKEQVFSEIWRVLKEGGELYFSDIFADRRLPERIAKDPILHGECLGGAMYIEDFRRLMQSVGWKDFRYMSTIPAAIGDEAIEELIGSIQFTSRTIRAFKLPGLIEDICEDYGQFASYQGGILGSQHTFDLDDRRSFIMNKPMSVCGNTCAMLEHTRFKKYFAIHGDRSHHFGAFVGCGISPEPGQGPSVDCSGSCC